MSTRERYTVRVTKDYLVFSAGHFITYAGDRCERIHGHNYRVAVEVEDDLDQNHYVVDFIALLEMSRKIVALLDHRMLLPDGTGLIQRHDDGGNWRLSFEERAWSFPKEECVVLPIANTTTELIATWFAAQLRAEMAQRAIALPRVLRVEIEENFGQSATVEMQG
jgi:6-pyruvoyltetrahydropterin/6-carboxytetrahydropterin synthase